MTWDEVGYLFNLFLNCDSVGLSLIEGGNEFQVVASETVKEDE